MSSFDTVFGLALGGYHFRAVATNVDETPHNRHSFAVNTLLDAYRTDGDPASRVAALSTYLGHVNPGKTYWYLHAAPELLELAGGRLERHLGDRR